MRFILGIIVGCAITVGGAYVADAILPSAVAKPMVKSTIVPATNATISGQAIIKLWPSGKAPRAAPCSCVR